MNSDRILGFAVDYAAYLNGSEYGQSGNSPAPPSELSETDAGWIRRLVGDGRLAAIARREHDESRATFHRESVAKLRGLVRSIGVSADELFSVGYRAVTAQYAH